MDVVVTGATGNVGTRVVSALIADGRVDHVVGVARRPPPEVALYDHPTFRWHTADISSDDLEGAFRGADAVIHLAWMFHPARDATATWLGNVIGTKRVLDAAVSAGVGAVIYASSVGAYSPAPGKPSVGPLVLGDRDQPVDETHPTHALPTAAYGRQKSYVERMLDAFELEQPTMRIARMRSAFVFQRPAAPEQRRIFAGPLLPGRLVGSRWIPVLPIPRGLRFQAVHTDDLAAAYVEATCRPVQGSFNIAGDGAIDRQALGRLFDANTLSVPVGAVRGAMASAFRARLAPAEPGLFELFMSLPLMNTQRAQHELDWAPTWSGIDAVGEFLAGLADPAGASTPPLHPQAGGPARVGEITTGVGARN